MPSHIQIGAVFAQAWVLFRRRFLLLLPLALLQAGSLVLGMMWRYLYLNFGLYASAPALYHFALQPYATPTMLTVHLALFVFSSTMMVMLTRPQGARPAVPFWPAVVRRFLPALITIAFCLCVIGMLFYGWFELFMEIISGPYSELVVIGVTLAAAMLLVAFASLFFVMLPVTTLESGGPLRAIRRGLALSAGQRWRLAAIILILLLSLVLGMVLISVPTDIMGLSVPGLTPLQYAFIAVGVVLTLFLLALTLVITAAYHQMVRLKDGVSAEEVGVVFE